MLFVGGGAVADSLARALTTLGVRLERVATSASRSAGAPGPALIVLAGDAAQGGGAGSLTQLQTGGDATPTLVVGAAEPAGGVLRQQPSHVAHLRSQVAEDSARCVHALLDALRRGDLAGSGLQPLVDRLANQGRAPAATPLGVAKAAVSAKAPPAIVLPPLKAANHNAGVRGLSEPGKAAGHAPVPAVSVAPKLQTPPKAAKVPDAAARAQPPLQTDRRVVPSGVQLTGGAAGAASPVVSPKVSVATKAPDKPATKDTAQAMQVSGAVEESASARPRGQTVPPPLPASKRASSSTTTPAVAPRAGETSAEPGNAVSPAPTAAVSPAGAVAPSAPSAPAAVKAVAAPAGGSAAPLAASMQPAVKSAGVPATAFAPSAARSMPSLVKSSGARTPAVALSVPSAAKSAASPTAASTLASARTPAKAVSVPSAASSGNVTASPTAREQPAAKSADVPGDAVASAAAHLPQAKKSPAATAVSSSAQPAVKASLNQTAAAAHASAPEVLQPKLAPQPLEPAAPFALGRGKTAAGLGPATTPLTGPAASLLVPAPAAVASAPAPVASPPALPSSEAAQADDSIVPLSLPPSELRHSTRASEIEISIALSDAPPARSEPPVRREVAAADAQTLAQAERETQPPPAQDKSARPARTASKRVGRSPLEPVAWSGMPLSAAMSDRAAKLVDPSGAAPTRRPRSPLEVPQVWPTASAPSEAAVLTKRPRNPLEAPQAWSAPARSAPANDTSAARPRRPRNPLEAPQGWPAAGRPREVSALEAENAAAPTVRPRSPLAWSADARAGAGQPLEADANAASVPTVRPPSSAQTPQAQFDAAHAFELKASSRTRRVNRGWIVGATALALGCGLFLLSRAYDRAQDPLQGSPAAGALVQTPALAAPAPEPPVQEARAPAPLPPPGHSTSVHVAETNERTTPSAARSATSAPRSSAREAAPTTPAGRAQALVDEGAAMLRQGRLGLAESKYMKALQESPEYPAALAELVRVHLARHDGREAVRWAERLVAVRNNGAHQLLLGDALLLRGNRGAAEEAWERAAELGNATARKRLSTGK